MAERYVKIKTMETRNEQSRFAYKVLLVDDDADDHEIFAYQFQNLKHDLQGFTSARSAIAYLQQLPRRDHPSLIVTDVQMPGITGPEFLSVLKNDRFLSHIPVVVYSSVMSESLQKQLKACGAAACFAKSRHLAELKECLFLLGVVFEHSVFI
jgi:CheY-like chemotaxis protein